jgi:hypothetical protein
MRMNSEKDIEMIMRSVMDNDDKNKVLWISGFYPNGKTAYYAVDLNE